MKRKMVIILATILVLALAVPAMAATVSSALTPDQAKELSTLHQQMINLR